MRLNSIRHRLLAIVALFLLSMGLVIYTQVSNVNRLVEIQSHADGLALLNNELLQLRRHEKDFLLRRELIYVEAFNRQAIAFIDHLDKIQGIDTQYDLSDSMLENLERGFEDYRDKFINLAALQAEMGLDQSSGRQAAFLGAVHGLEVQLTNNELAMPILQLMQLRGYEKDFILQRDLDYERLHKQGYEILREDLLSLGEPIDDSHITLLDDYRAGFHLLVATSREIGLDAESGLQGEFRAAALGVEQRLAEMIAALTPLIAERQVKVRQNGVAIVVLTSLLLSGILLHSSLRLNRAFSTLIMYFYRCKRQFEMLDQREIYFTEFKTVAEVVNEMVQSKKNAEYDLQEAREQLAHYEAKNPDSADAGEMNPDSPNSDEISPDNPITDEISPECPITDEIDTDSPYTEELFPESSHAGEVISDDLYTEKTIPAGPNTEAENPCRSITEEMVPASPNSEERWPDSSPTGEVIPGSSYTEDTKPASPITEEMNPASTNTEERIPARPSTEELIADFPQSGVRPPGDSQTGGMLPPGPTTQEELPDYLHTERVIPAGPLTEEMIPALSHNEEGFPGGPPSEEMDPYGPHTGKLIAGYPHTEARFPPGAHTEERIPHSPYPEE